MKILSTLVLALLLQGCYYQAVSDYDIKMAQDFCKDKEGVDYAQSWWIGTVKIYCNDGQYTRVSNYADELAEQKVNEQ